MTQPYSSLKHWWRLGAQEALRNSEQTVAQGAIWEESRPSSRQGMHAGWRSSCASWCVWLTDRHVRVSVVVRNVLMHGSDVLAASRGTSMVTK
jgi:hypothetical protein